MEKIVIAQLDLNTDELVKRASDTKKAINELRQANKELAKSEGDNTEAIVKNEAIIKKLSTEYQNQSKTITALVGTNNNLLKSEEALNIAINKESKSIDDARKNNAELLKIRNQVDATTVEGAKAIEQINKQIDKNNEFIKSNSSEQEKLKIGIGGYKDAIKEALSETNLLGGGLKQFGTAGKVAEIGFKAIQKGADDVKNTYIGFRQTQKATTEATQTLTQVQNQATVATERQTVAGFQMATSQTAVATTTTATNVALKAFRFALLATGIGAIVVVLGSLIAFLSSTQAGIDKVTAVTRPLTAVFEALFGVVQKFGGALLDAITSPIEAIKSAGGFLKDFFTSPLETVKNLAKDTGEFFNDAIKKGQELDRLEKSLSKLRIDSRVTLGRLTEEVAKQTNLSQDQNLTLEEREIATQKAIEANKQINILKQKELDLEIAILKNKQSRNDTSREEELQLQDLLAKKNELNAQEEQSNRRLQNNLRAIQKETNDKAIEERNKYFENEIKRQNELIDLYLAQQGLKAKSLDDEFLIAQELTVKRLKLLETEFKSGAISKTKYEAEKLNIANEFLQKQSELAVEIARREVKDKLAVLPSLIQGQKFISEEQLRLETERLNQVAELEKQFQSTRLKQGLISETEYQDAVFEIQKNAQLRIDDAEKLRRETIEEQRKIDIENESILYDDDFERLRSKLETEKQIELENAEKVGADLSLIEEKYARKSIEIENQVAEARRLAKLKELKDGLQLYAGLTDALQAFFGENKQIATASAIVNGGLAITEILAQKSELPAVATAIFKGLQIATVVGQTKSSIQQINSAKFADGTIQSIDGNSHARGGVPIYAGDKYIGEAEGNEGIGIFNKGAFNYINEVNARFRRGASDAGNYFENGAILSQGITLPNTGIDYNELARVVASAPPPIVRVDALNEAFEINQNIVKVASF
jgi:hypothetical protein